MNNQLVEDFKSYMHHVEVLEGFDEKKVKEIRVRKDLFWSLEVASNLHYHRMRLSSEGMLSNIPHVLCWRAFRGAEIPIVEDRELDELARVVFKEEAEASKNTDYTQNEFLIEQLKYLGSLVEGWAYTARMGKYEDNKKALDFRTAELNALIDKVGAIIIEIRKQV